MTGDRQREEDTLRTEARRWVRELATGEATLNDAAALRRWRATSDAHEAAFAEAVRVWKQLGAAGHAFIERQGAPEWQAARSGMSRRALLGSAGALAASVAAYTAIYPPLDLWPSVDELRADYRTATGEQRRLTVADVAIQLNTRTSIAIPGGPGDADRIELIAGEACFAMAPQPARPLVVLAGNGRTVASGGKFDVRHADASIYVTCIEGELRVEQGSEARTVGSRQQLRYSAAALGQAVAVDLGDVSSWQDGYIVFRYTPLSAAVAEINRYRPGKVVVLSAALGRKTISGRFRMDRTDEILAWIERAVGATSRSLPGGIVLLS